MTMIVSYNDDIQRNDFDLYVYEEKWYNTAKWITRKIVKVLINDIL